MITLIVVLVHYWSSVLLYGRPVIIVYLALWFVFLLANRGGLAPLFSSIREELRYYCIVDEQDG